MDIKVLLEDAIHELRGLAVRCRILLLEEAEIMAIVYKLEKVYENLPK